jgi:tetratricopeptide (TPR) repeat protein
MELRSKVKELIERAGEEEQALFARLSEAERSAAGEPDRWAPKDVLAHLAVWRGRMADNLAKAARGESPVQTVDFDKVNAQDFEEFRGWAWSDISEKAVDTSRQLAEQVAALSEPQLTGTDTLPWQGERPLWRLIVGNTYTHTILHLSPIYTERGELDYATALQEAAAERLRALDENQSWQGVVGYNLACHYALVGETERAIAGLREALQLNPDLTEWSKEDPDFAALREDPDYLALYAA